MLYEIRKDYTSLIFKSVSFPKPEIFLEFFLNKFTEPRAEFYVTHRHNSEIQNVSLVWEMKKTNKQTTAKANENGLKRS